MQRFVARCVPILTLILFLACLPAAWAQTLVFSPPNAEETSPRVINDAGQIAGTFYDGAVQSYRAFLREPDGQITVFDPPAGDTVLTGINEKGQIVGTVYHAPFYTKGFIREPNGEILVFDAPNATVTEASGGINETGEVAGTFYDDLAKINRGFIRDPNGGFYVWNVGGWVESVGGINDAGWTAGIGYTASGNTFLLEPYGGVVLFTVPGGGAELWVRGLNNAGQILVQNDNCGFDDDRCDVTASFLLEPDGQIMTVSPPESGWVWGRDLNDAGQITGETWNRWNGNNSVGQRAFLREPDGTYWAPNLGGGESWGEAINNLGQVTGRFRDSSGVYRGFLWTALPGETLVFEDEPAPEVPAAGNPDGDPDGGPEETTSDSGPGTGIGIREENPIQALLSGMTAKAIVIGDLDGNGMDDLIADFGSRAGIWIRTNNSSWTQLYDMTAETIAIGDLDGNGMDEVIVDFGRRTGIWIWENNSTWTSVGGVPLGR
jgi:hypothetical protein